MYVYIYVPFVPSFIVYTCFIHLQRCLTSFISGLRLVRWSKIVQSFYFYLIVRIGSCNMNDLLHHDWWNAVNGEFNRSLWCLALNCNIKKTSQYYAELIDNEAHNFFSSNYAYCWHNRANQILCFDFFI